MWKLRAEKLDCVTSNSMSRGSLLDLPEKLRAGLVNHADYRSATLAHCPVNDILDALSTPHSRLTLQLQVLFLQPTSWGWWRSPPSKSRVRWSARRQAWEEDRRVPRKGLESEPSRLGVIALLNSPLRQKRVGAFHRPICPSRDRVPRSRCWRTSSGSTGGLQHVDQLGQIFEHDFKKKYTIKII